MKTAAAKKRRAKRKPARCVPPKKRRRVKAKRSEVEVSARRRAKGKPTCRKPKPKPKPRPRPSAPTLPAAGGAAQPAPGAPAPPPVGTPPIASPIATHSGPFGTVEAERLLWRAGFGPSPGQAEALAAMGLEAAVQSLTRPQGQATLTGPNPTDDGDPLAPEDAWGHDHLWWLDRMVRTNQPLIERMTLVWHDWFATSTAGASQRLLLDQNAMFRRNALGSFEQMLVDVTADPAMILWLNANDNRRNSPNENYARELMELFTLGADRGAYTEDDVRELARALTGWRNDWSAELGEHNFRFDPARHDATAKTVFGHTGSYDWRAACGLCLHNGLHASFMVEKLWSYFIPVAPSAADRDALASAYVSGGHQVRPIVEAILCHPQLHAGPRMVKPPVVYAAGYMRRLGRGVDTGAWRWLSEGAGQALFRPPNVAGWDDERWLDSSTLRARWMMVTELLRGREIADDEFRDYDPTETPEAAVASALAFWGNPPVTQDGRSALTGFASSCLPAVMASWEQRQYRAARQNALRQFVAVSPDLQTS